MRLWGTRGVIPSGQTVAGNWAAPLADYRLAASEFIEALRPSTLLGKITGPRRVPMRVQIPRTTAGATVAWVGEAGPVPLSSMALDIVQLEKFKIAGIVVSTKELTKLSNPSAEGVVRTDLLAAVGALSDRAFIDPDQAGEAGVSPASITNGADTIAATGTTLAALQADLKMLFNVLADAGCNFISPYLITDRRSAIGMALMDAEFTRGVTCNGGMLAGVPLITSGAVPSAEAVLSPPEHDGSITLVDAGELLLADEGDAEIDMAQHATLQFSTTPDSPVTGSTTMINLWQHDLVAWRVTRGINWAMRRPGMVATITGARYGE